MDFQGKLESISGNKMIIDIPDGFDIKEIMRKSEEGILTVDFYEKDTITDLQRKQLFALWGDIRDYTGYPLDSIKDYVQYEFMLYKEMDNYPSISRNAMKKTVASEFIEFTVEHCLKNKIPFQDQEFHITADVSRILFCKLKYHVCFVCGTDENIEVAHVEAVGSGRNRKKIDHRKHHVMTLCWKHHREQHIKGIQTFMELHHIVPVKVTDEIALDLGLMSKKQIKELDEIKSTAEN